MKKMLPLIAAIEPIECFTVMPDHVHLLIDMRDQIAAQFVGDRGAAGGSHRSFAPIRTSQETAFALSPTVSLSPPTLLPETFP